MLDANVVIWLCHSHQNLWNMLLNRWEIVLPETIVNEVRSVDLSAEIAHHKIKVVQEPLSGIQDFFKQFDPTYQGRLDAGELEALACLSHADKSMQLCSGDAIVFKILGNIGREEQGLSLEEVLKQCGLTVSDLEWQFTKAFRDRFTKIGQIDRIQSRGSL
jgi:hypothetical protein